MPVTVATASSTLRVISVSSCEGATPGYGTVTTTVGISMSGRSWMPSFVKPTTPAIESATNSTITGTGRWMDQVTKFMCARARKAPARRPRPGFLGLDDVDAVAVLEESGAALDDALAALRDRR